MYVLLCSLLFRYEKWLKGEDVGPHPEEPDRKVAAPLPLPQDILCNKNNPSLPQSYVEGPFKKKKGRMMAGYPKYVVKLQVYKINVTLFL